ncbi:MAG: MarR family winged helix-turn-helix transcriptional regulator [Anaeroplasmataceae bacterium]
MNNKRIGYYMKVISIANTKRISNSLKGSDLTCQQMEILIYIYKNSHLNIHQKEIENFYSFKASSISGILKRLEQNDFISKVQGDDSRQKIIKLTEKSLSIMSEVEENRIKFDEQLLNGFSEKEISELRSYLERLKNNIIKEDKK